MDNNKMLGWKRNQQNRKIHGTIEKEIEGLVGKEEYREFKKFAFKKNMIELAIAFMLGGAFQQVVTAISKNLVMPAINYLISHTENDWREYIYSPIEGLTFEVGKFLGSLVDFLLIAIVLYILYRKIIYPVLQNEKEGEEKEEDKIKCIDKIDCPECCSKIYYKCKRCPHCTCEVKLFDE
jgi:large conductance mechanosensitive channel